MKKVLALILATLLVALVFVSCKKVEKKTVKVINIPLSTEEYAYCIAKDNTELLASVNAYLAEIKENGKFDEICNHYFGDGTPVKYSSCELDESKEQLVVATATGFEPFEMVDAGQYFGIDLEIAAGLAEYLGVELVISDMQFPSVLTSVEQGICDIGMSGLTVTPARQEVVAFSDSYYDASQVIVVNSDNTMFDDCKTSDDIVAILSSLTTETKAGCQTGTTGEIYVNGDAQEEGGYGFAGLPTTKMSYTYAALAVAAMANGEVDFVIVDNAPANAIAKSFND